MNTRFVLFFQSLFLLQPLLGSGVDQVANFYNAKRYSEKVSKEAFLCVLDSLRESIFSLRCDSCSSDSYIDITRLTDEDIRLSSIVGCVDIIKDIDRMVPAGSVLKPHLTQVLNHATLDDLSFYDECYRASIALKEGTKRRRIRHIK
jgi:hypothetical protein